MLNTVIKNAIMVAIKNPENLNEDGSINWNFVDSDLWMDGVITSENQTVAYEIFNNVADELEIPYDDEVLV